MNTDYVIEVEKKLLSALMVKNGEAIPSVADQLKPDDFYRAEHKEVYRALLKLCDEGRGVDILLVEGALGDKAKDVTPAYLLGLMPLEHSNLRATDYTKIVKAASTRRKLVELGQKVTAMARDEHYEVTDILSELETQMTSAAEDQTKRGVVSAMDLIGDIYSRFSEKAPKGLSTGYRNLDNLMGGLKPSNLIILAARPSMGKTALAMNIATNVAKTSPVLFFSLEMSRDELGVRLLAMQSTVNTIRIQNHAFTDAESAAIVTSLDKIHDLQLYIDDTPGITLAEMKIKARNIKREHGLSCIVVDYLQLVQCGSRYQGNRVQEVSELSRGLKVLAKELDIPVLALSQLSRGVELRAEKKPQLSDLRDSGSIEQDADIVMFLYRDEYYNQDDAEMKNIAEVIVAKNRNGATGSTALYFQREYQLFTEITRRDY